MNKKSHKLLEKYKLSEKIQNAADDAILKTKDLLDNIYDSVLYESEFTKSKIKNASLQEIRVLFSFYFKCQIAASNNEFAKLKRLSNLELDTIVREDYMDKKLRDLLVKYNEAAYS